MGDGWSWGQPSSDLENAFIAAGDTERLRWTIIKTGCKEIAGETQFDKFIENNATVFSGGAAHVGGCIFAALGQYLCHGIELCFAEVVHIVERGAAYALE